MSVVEQRLAESLTVYRQTREGEYLRRKREYISFKNVNIFVPIHFYSQLVCHDDGCDLLNEEVGVYVSVCVCVVKWTKRFLWFWRFNYFHVWPNFLLDHGLRPWGSKN